LIRNINSSFHETAFDDALRRQLSAVSLSDARPQLSGIQRIEMM